MQRVVLTNVSPVVKAIFYLHFLIKEGRAMSLSKYSNTELLDYPNCLGLSESGKCMWLSILKCQGYACPFLKTEGAPQRRPKGANTAAVP